MTKDLSLKLKAQRLKFCWRSFITSVSLFTILCSLFTIHSSQLKAQFRYGSPSFTPEIGLNLPSFIEKTGDMRVLIFPKNVVSFQIGFGAMFNNRLKGSFQSVEDGTSNWSNSGYYGSIGGRINFINDRPPMEPFSCYVTFKYLGGHYTQSCNYANPVSNKTQIIQTEGFFTAYVLEGGLRININQFLSMDTGLQISVTDYMSALQASETFSVLPGLGAVTLGAKPKLDLILAFKVDL